MCQEPQPRKSQDFRHGRAGGGRRAGRPEGKTIHLDRKGRPACAVGWSPMGFAVGIDLGTTNSVVGAVSGGVVATVTGPGGSRLIPSVVSFHPNGTVLVGHGALERRLLDPANTIYSVKRLIGRAWGSPEVEQAR